MGEKDAAEESGLAAASQTDLTDSIKGEVETSISDLTERTVGDQGGYLAGELNFFRRAAAEDIEEPVMELLVLAGYGDLIMDCDCAANLRIDYQLCNENARDVRFVKSVKTAGFEKNKMIIPPQTHNPRT